MRPMTSKQKRPRHWRDLNQLDPGLRLAVKAVGGSMTRLAELLDITPQAIAQWDTVPINRVVDIERATGIPRERLRPDMYPRRRAS